MIRYLPLAMLLFLPLAACANPETQAKVDAQVCSKYKESQAKLDALYGNITAQYAQDKVFIKNLKAAQEAWVKYRDAELKTIYPDEYRHSYGSIVRTCECTKLSQLNEARIKELEQWTKGSKDICAGTMQGVHSIKAPE